MEPVALEQQLLTALDPEYVGRHGLKSQLVIQLQPRDGLPWALCLNHYRSNHLWSETEKELIKVAARRFSGVLNNLVMHQRLQRREERLHLAVEAAGDGVWDWQVDTGAIVFSDSWAQILGYKPEEMPADIPGLERLVHADDLDRGKVVDRDADGNPLRVLGTRRDLSHTKHAEEMLLRERRLFTGGPCVVFRWVATDGWPVFFKSHTVARIWPRS